MRSARARLQFAAGRWLLARAACEVFGSGNYSVRTVDGLPILAAADAGPAACSISHSDDIVLCAAARARALGVDVERVRPRRDWSALAAGVLHGEEISRMADLEPARRWRQFYQAWTYKEALGKALGVGLALPFRRIIVSADGRIEHAPAEYALTGAGWHLCALNAGEGYAAALAWREA